MDGNDTDGITCVEIRYCRGAASPGLSSQLESSCLECIGTGRESLTKAENVSNHE